jgi:hypothetical protein
MRPKRDNVELRHYGRHKKVDRFLRRTFKNDKHYEKAWIIVAKIRQRWPAFERWTRGDLKWTSTYTNGITNVGKSSMAGLTGNTGSITAFTYLAWGNGTTAFNATQTALTGTEKMRAAATVSRVTTTVTNDTLQLLKAFSITATATAAEGGIFNASSGGTMLARVVFSPSRDVGVGDTLTYQHRVIFA